MRHFFAVILFFLATTCWIHSQSSDSIKVNLNSLPVLSNDSVLPFQNIIEVPDFKDFKDLGMNNYVHNQKTFQLCKSSNMKNIFNSSYSKFIIPVTMIFYGVLAQESPKLKQLDYSTHHEISEHFKSSIWFDDYSQYAPAVAVYALAPAGIKAKHNFRDRTIIMATSHIIMGATVTTIKNLINVERPDNPNNKSFPSGHTALAFVGAHILFREYKDTSPWIGVAGYAVATTTGALRVINKRHWVSDVAAGAGIGILSAELGYMLLPVFHNIFGIKDKKSNVVVIPEIGSDTYCVGLAYTF